MLQAHLYFYNTLLSDLCLGHKITLLPQGLIYHLQMLVRKGESYLHYLQ